MKVVPGGVAFILLTNLVIRSFAHWMLIHVSIIRRGISVPSFIPRNRSKVHDKQEAALYFYIKSLKSLKEVTDGLGIKACTKTYVVVLLYGRTIFLEW